MTIDEWKYKFISMIEVEITLNKKIYLKKVREIIKKNKFPRNQAMKFFHSFIVTNYLVKVKEESNHKVGRKNSFFVLRSFKPRICLKCNQPGSFVICCINCGKNYCDRHIKIVNQRAYCDKCITNGIACPQCSLSNIEGGKYNLMIPVDKSTFTCITVNCINYKVKITLQEIMNQWNEIMDEEIFERSFVETNPYHVDEDRTKDVICNNCGSNNTIRLEKTDEIESDERDMGIEYSYNYLEEAECECGASLSVELEYSWYAGDEQLIGVNYENCSSEE